MLVLPRPLWVKSGVQTGGLPFPVYLNKQTFRRSAETSQLGQKQK